MPLLTRGPYRVAALLAAFAVAALLSRPAAAAYDPALEWFTLETPHFAVHYHTGLEQLAQRTARAAEAAHARLVPMLGHAPSQRVNIVLSDETDSANGSAGAYLRPEVHLYASTPDSRSELNDYEDYLWNLITHEYTHVVHIDQAGGIPSWFNAIFGQLWLPNGMQPRWYVEGLAVWSESQLSGGGRDRAALYDMMLRAEILDGRFFGIDDAGGSPSRYPRGAIAYLHGSRFLDWLARTRGDQVLTRINAENGSSPIPYAIDLSAKSVVGRFWYQLYSEWRADLTANVQRLRARLEEQGLTPVHRLTTAGEMTGEPRYVGGRVFYVEGAAGRRAAVRAIDPATGRDQRLAELYGAGSLAVAPDARWAAVAQRVPHRTYYDFSDLFRIDLATGALEQLTFGARVDEPDIAPDGAHVAVVRHLGAGRSELAVLTLVDRTFQTAYVPAADCTVFTPRYSPNGATLAFSEQCPAGRDILIVELANGSVRRVTHDRAIDLEPSFDPSGRYLLFSSDRTGIYNLFAHDLTTGETRQVSNALTGAFQPSVSHDGERLAFVTYSSIGYDVAEMPFAPGEWRSAPPSYVDRPAAPAWDTARTTYPVEPYRALPTLRPYYWSPIFQYGGLGYEVGAETSGSDSVDLHLWTLTATWGLDTNALGVDATYATSVFRPELAFAAGSHLFPVPHAPNGELERQTAAGVTASWPFAWHDRSLSFSLGYSARYYDPPSFGVPSAPDDDLPFRPDRGLSSGVSASVGFSNAHGYIDSISLERGLSARLTLRRAGPETASAFTFQSAQASATAYLGVPWLESHVLALGLGGGVSAGDIGHRAVFSLGGIGIRDPVQDFMNGTGAFGAALRGYAPFAFSGSRFVLANAEYRFPILRVDTGLWTLPVYVGRLHGALTADAGLAADRITLAQLRPSLGAELRGRVLLGFAMPIDLRLGYARGLAREGIGELFFGIGSSY